MTQAKKSEREKAVESLLRKTSSLGPETVEGQMLADRKLARAMIAYGLRAHMPEAVLAGVKTLAANPVRKLVVPRVAALVLALPLLTILADTIALFGGLVMAVVEIGQTRMYYMSHVLGAITVRDIFSGVGKTVFFAFFIGIIACYNGINATGGADGVGKATTQTVVASSISVIISDFFLTKLLLLLPTEQMLARLAGMVS